MRLEESVFASLHKWARGQDENYCTEGLIYVLRLMLRETPREALDVIGWLTDGLIGVGHAADTVRLDGQVNAESGQPDLEITSGSAKAWIEVKVDAPVGLDQLERYRRELGTPHPERKLILLSRGGGELALGNRPEAYRRWFDLAMRLDAMLRMMKGPLKVSVILEDYLAFLGTKQMKPTAVTPEASRSITDVGTLLAQIKLACPAAGLKDPRPSFSDLEHTLGYYLKDGSRFVGWIGINLTDPQWLFYTTDMGKESKEIDLAIAAQSDLPGAAVMGKHWTNSIDLIGCTDYLNASAGDQVEYLRKHLVESVAAFHEMIVAPVQ